jgi:RNase P/RNase MRP subunit POP5
MVHPNRRRYVVVHITFPQDMGKGLLIKLMRDRTRSLPEERFTEIKPWLVYFERGWAIVRTGHRGSDELLGILKGLDGTKLREGPLQLRVVGVSGTLRAAFYKHIPEPARNGLTYQREVEAKTGTMAKRSGRTQ